MVQLLNEYSHTPDDPIDSLAFKLPTHQNKLLQSIDAL